MSDDGPDTCSSPQEIDAGIERMRSILMESRTGADANVANNRKRKADADDSVDDRALKYGGGYGDLAATFLRGRALANTSTDITTQDVANQTDAQKMVDQLIIATMAFTLYVCIVASLRYISWEAAAVYIKHFDDSFSNDVFTGDAFQALKGAIEGVGYAMDDAAHACIPSDLPVAWTMKMGRVLYESAYFVATRGQREACVDILKYQVFMAENRANMQNIGHAILTSLMTAATGKTIAQNVYDAVREEYHRVDRTPLFTMNPDECALAPMYRGDTDLFGNPLNGGGRRKRTHVRKHPSRRSRSIPARARKDTRARTRTRTNKKRAGSKSKRFGKYRHSKT